MAATTGTGDAPATPQLVTEMPLPQPPSPEWYETQETPPVSQQWTFTGCTQIFPIDTMDHDDQSL